MYKRNQHFTHSASHSFFFWGARQTGKSTLLKKRYAKSVYFDLLKSDQYARLIKNPEILRHTILAEKPKLPVIIDEIQRIPALLNEVHWLIENTGVQFILTGSSPRKILRNGSNLLGGRALRYELCPLSYSEIDNFDLSRALNNGLLPKHYDAKSAEILLRAYIGSYIEDEILAESKVRKLSVFSEFLEKAAFSNGEIVNYTNIATDCGVSSPTVKEYFNILTETMIGRYVPSYQKKPKRRVVASPKFYFFDVGIANHLRKRKNLEPGSEHYGDAFEHFIYMELVAYSQYSGKHFRISYWRTSSGFEVDFIIGDNQVAIEVKSTANVVARHMKGLRAFAEEYETPHKLVVSRNEHSQLIGDIIILPWQKFLDKLWAGAYI